MESRKIMWKPWFIRCTPTPASKTCRCRGAGTRPQATPCGKSHSGSHSNLRHNWSIPVCPTVGWKWIVQVVRKMKVEPEMMLLWWQYDGASNMIAKQNKYIILNKNQRLSDIQQNWVFHAVLFILSLSLFVFPVWWSWLFPLRHVSVKRPVEAAKWSRKNTAMTLNHPPAGQPSKMGLKTQGWRAWSPNDSSYSSTSMLNIFMD